MRHSTYNAACSSAVIWRIGLAALLTITWQIRVLGQSPVPSPTMAEYAGLPALQNPDAYHYKPLPVTLSDEADFRVILYPTKNPLLLKLLIGNRKGRKWALKLETDREELLHFETRRTDWAWQLLNLQDLPEGRYRLVLSAGPHYIVHLFSIVSPRLMELTAGRTIVF